MEESLYSNNTTALAGGTSVPTDNSPYSNNTTALAGGTSTDSVTPDFCILTSNNSYSCFTS